MWGRRALYQGSRFILLVNCVGFNFDIVNYFLKDKAGKHRGSFWNYQKLVYAEKLVCLNFRGTNTFLADKILLSQQQNELTK
jgi:hypothetical protein